MKYPEIPELNSYGTKPGSDFWKVFPFRQMPSEIATKVNAKKLDELLDQLKQKLTPSQFDRGKRVVNNLKVGAPSCQKNPLPAYQAKNADGALKHGREVTDTIAHWVKSGFASGPFDSPPLSKFRVNSLAAVPQDGKVRPVINVSEPKDYSFNDNIDKNKLEKVKMTSARNFGYSLKNCGKNAKFSKFDMKDAYKQVPCPLSDLRLQGFCWLNKYFFETSQMFGAKTAVPNYDTLGSTVEVVTHVQCDESPGDVHRHLDDVPTVSPASSNFCEQFSEKYVKVCKDLNIDLAENCPAREKAFSNETSGKVLGIWFDSTDLSWTLPQDKKDKTLRAIFDAKNNNLLSILEMQKLMGNLNNVSMMCPFLNGFRRNLNDDLSFSMNSSADLVRLSDQSKKDLNIWAGCLLDSDQKLPIPTCPNDPPLCHKSFTSDAAGCADDASRDAGPGVACIGLSEDGEISFAARHLWNIVMIEDMRDLDEKRFRNKTAFLEFVGVIMPFILVPSCLKNQHVVSKVDNISCVYAWENRGMKNDTYTSILIRALHLISSYLCTIVHVQHLPRDTSWESKIVDRMSREKTCRHSDRNILKEFGTHTFPVFFSSWLKNPVCDWDIANELLTYVKHLCEK